MVKLDDFQNWLLLSPIGRYTLHYERVFYHNIIPRVFGYYSLQIGLPEINFLQGSKISNHYVLDHDIKASLSFLPFANNSIDLIVCPHILEFTPNYHHLLQECYRVLIPNGKIIITSFNKNSFFQIFLRRENAIKNTNFISLNTLKQQLNTLNFFIEGGKFFGFRPPINNAKILAKLSFMDKIGDRWLPTFANSYAIIASKELITPTIIRSKPQLSDLKLSPKFRTSILEQTQYTWQRPTQNEK